MTSRSATSPRLTPTAWQALKDVTLTIPVAVRPSRAHGAAVHADANPRHLAAPTAHICLATSTCSKDKDPFVARWVTCPRNSRFTQASAEKLLDTSRCSRIAGPGHGAVGRSLAAHSQPPDVRKAKLAESPAACGSASGSRLRCSATPNCSSWTATAGLDPAERVRSSPAQRAGRERVVLLSTHIVET